MSCKPINWFDIEEETKDHIIHKKSIRSPPICKLIKYDSTIQDLLRDDNCAPQSISDFSVFQGHALGNKRAIDRICSWYTSRRSMAIIDTSGDVISSRYRINWSHADLSFTQLTVL